MKVAAILGLMAVSLSLRAQTIHVYINNCAAVRGLDLGAATAKAGELLAPAGVYVEWRRDGEASGGEDGLRPIFVHIVRDMPRQPKALAFAQAIEGSHLTILYDRVARIDPTRVQLILGYVLAHEITHLLQGIERHSNTGVMKASWSWTDQFEMRCGKLALGDEDIVLIRLGMEARQARTLMAAAR